MDAIGIRVTFLKSKISKPIVRAALTYPSPMLRQSNTTLGFDTRGRGLIEITRPVADWAVASGMENGLLTLFVRHTSASLVVQENADPDVRGDLERFFARLVPTATRSSVIAMRVPTTCPRTSARR